jgi:hypothetical protein
MLHYHFINFWLFTTKINPTIIDFRKIYFSYLLHLLILLTFSIHSIIKLLLGVVSENPDEIPEHKRKEYEHVQVHG